jgi:hypothetical protein
LVQREEGVAVSLKKLVMVGVVIGLIIYGVKYFKETDQRAFHEFSVDRVENVFANLESGSISDEEVAIAYFFVGHPAPASEDSEKAFLQFLNEKGLSKKNGSYEFISSELVDGDDVLNRYVRLKCKVQGHKLTMNIYNKAPLMWE